MIFLVILNQYRREKVRITVKMINSIFKEVWKILIKKGINFYYKVNAFLFALYSWNLIDILLIND